MKELLFKKVSCDGFLAKVRDGRFMLYDEDHISYACCSDGSFQKAEEVDKTYYQFKESSFSGVVVGFKDIVVRGRIDACYKWSKVGSLYFPSEEAAKAAVEAVGEARVKKYYLRVMGSVLI